MRRLSMFTLNINYPGNMQYILEFMNGIRYAPMDNFYFNVLYKDHENYIRLNYIHEHMILTNSAYTVIEKPLEDGSCNGVSLFELLHFTNGLYFDILTFKFISMYDVFVSLAAEGGGQWVGLSAKPRLYWVDYYAAILLDTGIFNHSIKNALHKVNNYRGKILKRSLA